MSRFDSMIEHVKSPAMCFQAHYAAVGMLLISLSEYLDDKYRFEGTINIIIDIILIFASLGPLVYVFMIFLFIISFFILLSYTVQDSIKEYRKK